MINQVMVKPVENTALAAAAASFLDVVSELHAARRNVVTDLIGGAPFTQWDHYPSEDFHDPATGALFFYHAHDPAARIDGEHGHFHCFVEQSRIAPTALPIFKPARRNGSKALCHLVAVTIDLNGLPAALFTTNQWVTDEWLYPAQAVIPLIDAFRFPSSQDTSLVSRWLTELVALFRPQIVELLVQRDLTLRCDGKRATRKVRRRSIEVVSQLAIDVDAQIAEITGSSETCDRGTSAYQLRDIGGRLQLAKLCLPVCRCTTLKLLGDKPSARTHQPERSSNVLFPATTAIFAAVLALVYASMTVWVMASRTSNGTLQGDGGNEGLQNRIRAHGNFGEYVPLALVLIGLLESGGGNHAVVLALLWVLLVGRLLHPVGLFARPNSAQMFACRGGGMLATLVSLVVAAVAVLVRHV